MKPIALLVAVVLLIAVARCGQSGAASDTAVRSVATLPDTVSLAYQDTLFLSATDWLTFQTLVHDSRCPTGITCVWEGNAEVGFALFQGERRHAFALNTHPKFRRDTTLAALSVALLDLTPYPHKDSTYKTGQFAVRIFVDR